MYEEAPTSCACDRVPTQSLTPIPPPAARLGSHSYFALSSAFSPAHCQVRSALFHAILSFRPWIMDTSDPALTIIRFRRSLLCRRWLPHQRHPFHGLPQFCIYLRSDDLGKPSISNLNHLAHLQTFTQAKAVKPRVTNSVLFRLSQASQP